jgi:hypothetical protein
MLCCCHRYELTRYAFGRKKFASFTVSEMVSLIKALFDDSPKRDTILTKIQEMAI